MDRRAFLQKAAIGLLGVTAGPSILARSTAVALPQTGGIPPLDAEGQILKVVVHPDRVLAIGFDAEGSAAWRFFFANGAWEQVASKVSFPSGTVLRSATQFGGDTLAVGEIDQVVAGITYQDENDQQTTVEVHGVRPVILRSSDDSTWHVVLDAVPGIEWANLAAVVSLQGVSQILAVGTRFRESGPQEGAGLVVLRSTDGVSWANTNLQGVPAPGHGGVTLLNQAGTDAYLATLSGGAASAYRATAADGYTSWHPVGRPAASSLDIVLTAAVRTSSGIVLAGVDRHENPYLWKRTMSGWSQMPTPLVGPARIFDLDVVSNEYIAAGCGLDGGFVRAWEVDNV